MELRRRFRVRAYFALATAATILTAVFGVSGNVPKAEAVTSVPYLINFQGRLTDNSGNVLADGSYNVKFRLWDNLTTGTNRWEGDRVITASDNRISVVNGLFNIQFGDTTKGDPALSPTLFNTQTYANLYLEVELPTPATANCATNGCAVFTEGAMTPRQPLASSPYAFNSDTLDGIDSAAFGQLAAANTFTGANTFTPTTGVGITVRAAAATHSLDVKDSSGTTQAFFDATGILNVGQTIQPTTNNAVDLGLSGTTFRTGYFGTSVQTPALNATTSGGTITTNLGTLQRTASGTTTIDLKDAGTTTLAVTNSGGGVAGISATGGLTIGTGKVITVGATPGTGVTCTSGQVLDAVVISGGVVTGGACIAAGGGDKLSATWTSQQATTTTNQQTTVQFTGAANSAPSFNNATHVLTLPSNASKITVETKAGGGGGGAVGVANAIKAAGGGGEGGASQLSITSSLASTYYLKVGAGGAGGVAGNNNGTTGSSSCFGANAADACTTPLASALGGGGGVFSNAAVPSAGGAGGLGLSGAGDTKISGAPGGNGTSTATTGMQSGPGGGSGGATGLVASAAGNAGTSGGGGSGAIQSTAVATSRAGGNGGDGYLKITVYTTVAGTGNPATLQSAYDNSTNPEIQLSSSGLSVEDSAGGVAGNIFEVQDSTGATTYLGVTSAGISSSGVLSVATTNSINNLSVNNGALSGVTGYSQTSGTVSQTLSSGTSASAHSIGVTNTNTSATASTVSALNISATGTSNANANANTVNAISLGNVTPITNNTFTALNLGSGYTSYINAPNLDINGSGDISGSMTTLNGSTTTNGTGTASTSMTVTSATNFDIGNYVQLTNTAACTAGGPTTCYAKITAIAGNVLTITPALTWATGRAVVEMHIPEIGGLDTTQVLANRYGRGYFIAGVATGNGTTYYSEDGIETSLASYNIGTAGTQVNVSGTLNVTGNLVAPAAGTNGYLSRSGTTLSPANAGDSLTTTGNISTTGTGSLSSGGAITAPTATNTINGLVINGGTITAGTWQGSAVAATYGGTGQSTYVIGDMLYANSTTSLARLAAVATGQCLLSQGTGTAPVWGACGTGSANATLSNLGTTSINSSLIPALNNSIDLGSTTKGWNNVYTDNLDTGTVTTALSVGSTNASAITVGKAGLTVSVPGGISSSGAISTSGNISTTGSGVIASAGAITAPTTTNTINGAIINAGALSSITGYTQTSGTLSVTSVATTGNVLSVTDNAFTANNANLQSLAFTNANASATSTTVNGLSITPVGGTNGNANANKLNAINLPNVTAVTNNAFTGINIGSGYNTLLSSPTAVLSGAGAWTGLTGITSSGAYTQSGTSANLLTGATTVNTAAYTTNQFVLNNGLSSAVPTIPNAYLPTETIRVAQTSGSRPLFFGYDDGTGTGWAATMNVGACGAFTQMCVNLGNGTANSTAFYNTGTTLGIGGGPDGNFTNVTFNNTGTTTVGALTTGAITAPTATNTINGAIINAGVITANGSGLTNLNPTNFTTGTGAVTLQPAAASGLNLTSTGASAITISPGTAGLNTNLAAGTTATFAATAAMTADMMALTNTSAANAGTADGINLQQQTFYSKPAGANTQSSTRINLFNANTGAGGQANAIRIVASGAGGAIASDTAGLFIDPLANSSTGSANENAIEIGANWDAGFFVQSGGNTIKATSTTGLLVTNASSVASLTVDTSGGKVQIGAGTSDSNQILLQLDSYEAAANSIADTATCNATTNVGALYYNTETNAVRACVNSNWEDVMTTAGLGIIVYGVVPDSGLNPGDLPATTTASVTGPCRVSWATTTTVTVQPCVAYSGGRKIIVTGDATRQTMTTQTVTIPTGTANAFTHICLNTASTFQPNASTISATESANLPTFSINNPILCLADVKLTAAGTAIAAVYDVRTFTNTQKEFVTTAAATPLGVAVSPSGTGIAVPGAASALRGIVVASNGAAVAGGVPNAIIATSGPAAVKATGGTSGNIAQNTGTAGYVFTAGASATAYANLGYTRTTFPLTACTTTATAANCNTSLFINLNIK